jgi:hypothetical protein
MAVYVRVASLHAVAKKEVFSIAVCPGRAVMRILDPIDGRSYSYEDRDRLAEEVRARMAAALKEISGPS